MSSPQQPPPPDPQAAQAGLAVLVGLAVAKLWPSLDLFHLREALPAFKAAVVQEVQRHAQVSATLAARQYRQQRVAAGVGGGFTPVPADPPPVEQIARAVDYAVQPLWSADVLAQPVTEAGSTAIADAKARLAAASERLVLDTGGQTITDNVQADRKARGYARIPEPGACAFCLMLATRGAVYKADRAGRTSNGRSPRLRALGIQKGDVHGDGDSFAASNAKFKDGKVPSTIKVHDYCRCHVEPVFGAYEMTARARAAEQLWIVAGEGRGGKSARDAFRAAVDGTVNNKSGRPYFTPDQLARIAELRDQLK